MAAARLQNPLSAQSSLFYQIAKSTRGLFDTDCDEMSPLTTEDDLRAALSNRAIWKLVMGDQAEAHRRMDWLDKSILNCTPFTDVTLYATALRRLRGLCRVTGQLPTSSLLQGDIIVRKDVPPHQSALSDVYQGNMGGLLVAVKVLRCHADDLEKIHKIFNDEVVIWKAIRHPNILPFLGVSPKFPASLISEWMHHGTIRAYLQEHPLTRRRTFITQILSGLHYIHQLGVVHGDLKSANVLIDEAENAVLTDFGVATLMRNSSSAGASDTRTAMRGTLRWMAPEMLAYDAEDHGGTRPTVASDMYALATLIWEIFTARVPYDNINNDYLLTKAVIGGLRPSRPSIHTAPELYEPLWARMQECWHADPALRPDLLRVAAALDLVLDKRSHTFILRSGLSVVASDDTQHAGRRSQIRIAAIELTIVLFLFGLAVYKLTQYR